MDNSQFDLCSAREFENLQSRIELLENLVKVSFPSLFDEIDSFKDRLVEFDDRHKQLAGNFYSDTSVNCRVEMDSYEELKKFTITELKVLRERLVVAEHRWWITVVWLSSVIVYLVFF